MPWVLKPKRKVNLEINDQINEFLYNWIIHQPQVVQSPIFNYCLKINIDGHTTPPIVPKLLLQVYVQELNNILVSDPVDGAIKEVKEAEHNIIINDSTLCSLFPPRLKLYSSRYKFMCGYECCISAKIINLSLLSWRVRYLKNSNIKSKNRRSGEKSNRIYKTYKNKVIPHELRIYAKVYDMAKATMCVYPQSDHALPHW